MATARVLVVDSDRDRAGMIASRARSPRWETSLAVGTDRGREALRQPTPLSLALVDGSVWSDPGFRAALMEAHPQLPVVVLTGSEETPNALIERLHLGAMSYIPRDAASRRLIDTVHTIITLTGRSPYRERVREFLRAGAVELHIANDPALIPLVVGYTQRILEDYGLTSEREQTRLGIALTEALSNAIVHGNLEISSACRGGLDDEYYTQIETRRTMEPYISRAVHVTMRFSQSSATFVIRDQGKGFDPGELRDPTAPENLEAPCGRGVLLMRAYTDAISWNEAGNEVTMTKSLSGRG